MWPYLLTSSSLTEWCWFGGNVSCIIYFADCNNDLNIRTDSSNGLFVSRRSSSINHSNHRQSFKYVLWWWDGTMKYILPVFFFSFFPVRQLEYLPFFGLHTIVRFPFLCFSFLFSSFLFFIPFAFDGMVFTKLFFFHIVHNHLQCRVHCKMINWN